MSPQLFSSIITAAGKADESYLSLNPSVPKNLTVIRNQPILSRAFATYRSLDPSRTRVAISAEENETHQTPLALADSIPRPCFVLVNSHLKGALVSALVASSGLDPDSPLIVAGGDSEIVGGIQNIVNEFVDGHYAAGVIVFESTEPRWSYIKHTSDGMVIQVSEKKVIGEFATTGTFYFDSVETFRASAKWCLVNNVQTNGNYFVSSALNFVISQGSKVGYRQIPATDYANYRFASDGSKEGK
jgi:bifunctional N-acetylglucosamine-1-phosphate-uridyltransferase/glucosamine-1-phosphate-acetyltransferase GlmU-like protein